MKECKAYIIRGRLYFDIRKGDDGYEEFVEAIEQFAPYPNAGNDVSSWYGDIKRPDGSEATGLVVHFKGLTDKSMAGAK